MKKIIAILGLLMVFMIQLGSTGFSVYKNECNKEKISSYSITDLGCVCKKNDVNNTEESSGCCSKALKKSCCEVEKKSCCSTNSDKKTETTISNICCTSDLMAFKLLCETFNLDNSQTAHLSSDIDFKIDPVLKIDDLYHISALSNNDLNCHPPPDLGINTRIFIQSFQI